MRIIREQRARACVCVNGDDQSKCGLCAWICVSSTRVKQETPIPSVTLTNFAFYLRTLMQIF